MFFLCVSVYIRLFDAQHLSWECKNINFFKLKYFHPLKFHHIHSIWFLSGFIINNFWFYYFKKDCKSPYFWISSLKNYKYNCYRLLWDLVGLSSHSPLKSFFHCPFCFLKTFFSIWTVKSLNIISKKTKKQLTNNYISHKKKQNNPLKFPIILPLSILPK